MARGEDGSGSDVDLLADMPRGLGMLGPARNELEAILDARVDLVPADLKPGIAG